MERTALEHVIDQAPGNTQALERLAVLATASGRSDRATELRRRKAGIDQAKERYTRFMEANKPIMPYAELAALAEKLGRGFEARGWWFLAPRYEPSAIVASAVERLGPPHPDPRLPAGKALAAYLAATAGLPMSEPSSSGGGPGSAPVSTRMPPNAATVMSAPEFRDDAASAGLRFVFDNGQSPLRQLPETTSGGVALLDYDGDGWLDLYVVQGVPVSRRSERQRPTGDRLFRNRGDGTFEDATERSGIAAMKREVTAMVSPSPTSTTTAVPTSSSLAGARTALYRNRGDGAFEDITDRAGLGGDRGWPTSAAFADLDNDGDLDLYVCRYLIWDAAHPKLCNRPTKPGEPVDPNHIYDYCMPNPFPAQAESTVPQRPWPVRGRDGRGWHRRPQRAGHGGRRRGH